MRTWNKRLILCALFCILCPVLQAAQIIRYVDPDAAGAGTGLDWTNAYTSLSAWEAAEQQDLTDAGGDYMTVYCRSSGGTDDTTNFTILGWTTSATDYIEIIGNDFPADGIFDATKYVLHNNANSGAAVTINEDYVRFSNIQFELTVSGVGAAQAVYIAAVGAATDIRFDSCIVKGVCSGTGVGYGIRVNHGAATVKIFNSLIIDFVSGADADFIGLWSQACSAMTAYNCTIYGNYRGFYETAGSTFAYNCAVGGNTDDFNALNTVDYCCSTAGEGTNAQTPAGGNWANEFTNTAGGDFSLLSGGNCVGNGTDNPGAGLYSDDIIGTARSSIWDIGAFEYVAPPAAGGQVIIINME